MFDEVLNINLQINDLPSGAILTDSGPVSDEALVTAVLDGDGAAFAEIFDRYKLPVTRVVGRFFRERSEIEEFVQQCFTKAYFSLDKYRGGEQNSFPAWLTRIAVNVCYDEFRRKTRRPESSFTDMSTDECDYVESVVDGREPAVDRRLVASQLVQKVLGSLNEKDRVAMALFYCQEYSLGEIAEITGLSASNLKTRLFRCRNQLRERFKDLFT
jgi:RNA polymerase sigma-70 factor (ECF subfamily)